MRKSGLMHGQRATAMTHCSFIQLVTTQAIIRDCQLVQPRTSQEIQSTRISREKELHSVSPPWTDRAA